MFIVVERDLGQLRNIKVLRIGNNGRDGHQVVISMK